MNFNLAEKLAIVKEIDSTIRADDIIHSGEIDHMQKLMESIDFDTNFIVDARNIPQNEGVKILRGMSPQKKNALAVILEDVANSDGFVHAKERAHMSSIFFAINIKDMVNNTQHFGK
mgnify:CR=1 FL=1